VRQVWERFAALKIDPRMKQVAAVGVKTRAELMRHGITPAITPEEHSAEALFRELPAKLTNQRILLPQADRARPLLANLLTGAGAEVETIAAYHTIEVPSNEPFPACDAVTFTSPSTIDSFVTRFPDARIGDALIACIGPVTAEGAQQVGLPVHVIAQPHTAEGLVSGLIAAFERTAIP
jgi:uroporphyrinogen-III synthase